MREYRVVCTVREEVVDGDEEAVCRRAARLDGVLKWSCGPHRVQFRDVPDWQDLEDEL